MSSLIGEISHIVNSPISSAIGSDLLSTIEAAGTLRAALQMSPFADLVYEVIILDELKYAYLLAGEEYSFYDLLINMSCRHLYERLPIALNFL